MVGYVPDPRPCQVPSNGASGCTSGCRSGSMPQSLSAGGVYVRRADMLRAETPADDDRRDELQRAATDELRHTDRRQVTGQIGFDRAVLDEHLTGLDDSGW